MEIPKKKFHKSEVTIISAHDVESNLLNKFYDQAYDTKHAHLLKNHWKWRYRTEYHNKKIPLVMVYKNTVIAHAGMVPFKVFVDGQVMEASWFIDFAVLPEFQRCGLGSMITEKWMNFSDLCVAMNCNEKSIRFFKKYGWTESFDTYLHHYPLNPFDYPKIASYVPSVMRKSLNKVLSLFLKNMNYKHSLRRDHIQLENLMDDFVDLFDRHSNFANDIVYPVRDPDFFSWRLFNSPNKISYRLFRLKNADHAMIIKLNDNYNIDVLWHSEDIDYQYFQTMMSTLATWGIEEGFCYIRYYTSSKTLSKYLSNGLKPLVKSPRFVYYTKDSNLKNKLTNSSFHWSLIDSDFEEI